MKKGTEMKMADMDAGKYCGVCHTGEKAFSTKDQGNCLKCHQAQK
jgi:c(7)-type cytochrome triheme protein